MGKEKVFSTVHKNRLNIFKLIRSSLRAKLMLIFVVLTSIPLSIVGVICYTKFFTTIWDDTTLSTIQIGEQLNKNIEIMFNDTRNFLEIGNREAAIQFLKTETETNNAAKEILNLFNLYRNNYKYRFSSSIKNIHIIGINGKCISERDGVYRVNKAFLSQKAIQELLDRPGEVQILPEYQSYIDQSDPQRAITIGVAIRRATTHEVLGVTLIELDTAIANEFCDNVKIGKTGFFYILDRKGSLISTPSQNAIISENDRTYFKRIMRQRKGSFFKKVAGKKIFVVYNTSLLTGWKIIGQVNLEDIMRQAYDIRDLIIISLAICFIFSVAVYSFITDRLTLPIRRLKNKIRQASTGDLDVKVENEKNDEIADVGYSFNMMLDRIKALLENSLREQEELKKAELKALQAQINPHFLYNTLDTIVWMSEANKSEQVVEIVNALSSFFRISLSKGKDWISVGDEVQHIRSYLIIQKMRYRDILDYKIDVPGDILHYSVLKLTLQPIVENALYHGIKNKREKGCIQIKGWVADDGDLVFEVLDNGAGIIEEKLAVIQRELHSDSFGMIRDTGFGLNNVHRRIQLYYGKPYGISIESIYGQFTRVNIRIPARR